jgi:hypothetical protein
MDTDTHVRGKAPFDLKSHLEPTAPRADIGRVLVVISKEDGDSTNSAIFGASRALKEWLASEGYAYPNGDKIDFLHVGNGLLMPRLARDIPWTELPVLGGPYWRLRGDLALLTEIPPSDAYRDPSDARYEATPVDARWLIDRISGSDGKQPAVVLFPRAEYDPTPLACGRFYEALNLLCEENATLGGDEANLGSIRFCCSGPDYSL